MEQADAEHNQKHTSINPFTGLRGYMGEPKIALQPDFAGIAAVQIVPF